MTCGKRENKNTLSTNFSVLLHIVDKEKCDLKIVQELQEGGMHSHTNSEQINSTSVPANANVD